MVPAETCSYEPIREVNASGPKVMVDGGRGGVGEARAFVAAC